MNLILPKTGQKVLLKGLVGDSCVLELARCAERCEAPVICIVADNAAATRMQRSLAVFSGDRLGIHTMPDWETLPYDSFSPHADIISARVEVLYQLAQMKKSVLFVPVATLMQRLPPQEYLRRHTLLLKIGDKLNSTTFSVTLADAGYRRVAQVFEHGEFALRGSIIDLFPSAAQSPIRIDLFDDEIETLRLFDIESQCSDEKIGEFRLLPAHEFSLDQDSIARFRRNWRSVFEVHRDEGSIYQQVSAGFSPPGVEYYLPFFHDHLQTLFDYLPPDAVIVEIGNSQALHARQWQEIEQHYQQRQVSEFRPPLPPAELYLKFDQYCARLGQFRRLQFSTDPANKKIPAGCVQRAYQELADLTLDHRLQPPLQRFRDWLEQQRIPTLLFAETLGRREQLVAWLRDAGITFESCTNWSDFNPVAAQGLHLTVGVLNQGFTAVGQYNVVAEAQLYGDQVPSRSTDTKHRGLDPAAIFRNLTELQLDAPVVHLEQGIGRYLGLTRLDVTGVEAEFLTIEFRGGDKLYVPVHALDQISRYSGSADSAAPISRLGSEQWLKTRKKAAAKIRDVAAELLEVLAQRAARPGIKIKAVPTELARFSASFPFAETADQATAIEAVLEDLARPTPMERLVCGDVGFGKTEVAMRASFATVSSGAQVAILVPTTLLAQQHFDNFQDRFADWPVKIKLLSRFRSNKDQVETLQGLENGQVDIVIGTHRLLQSSVHFKNLGLLIIDEEHRFGVKQKERLKQFKANVDILSLTATPIPRTLNMALSGLRDLSIIATPPPRRLSVMTFVRAQDDGLLKDAIAREVRRGGQVFFVHNTVETIEHRAQHLRGLLPELRIEVGHGQMREIQLERIMQDFYHQRFQVLVCTTIIETGIDIPSANTIIIDRADHFGLAQLHQLRGRVGRSHHQAYAYLLVPASQKLITRDALKRLEAIQKMDRLGSGFLLATQDLEIRGAGEILGEDQSGQIQSIGFSLYMEMLERAVSALKEGREPSMALVLQDKAEVEIQLPALLPDSYVADVSLRLSLYKRIAAAMTATDLDRLQVELIDRFGLLPEATKNLFVISRLRQCCGRLGIRKIHCGAEGGFVEFLESTLIEPMTIITLIQTRADRYRMQGPSRLRFNLALPSPLKRLEFIQQLLDRFEGSKKN